MFSQNSVSQPKKTKKQTKRHVPNLTPKVLSQRAQQKKAQTSAKKHYRTFSRFSALSGRFERGVAESGVFAFACQCIVSSRPDRQRTVIEMRHSVLVEGRPIARNNRLPVHCRRLRSLRHRTVRGLRMGGCIRRGWISRFWGAPNFSAEAPKCFFKGFLEPLEGKSGHPKMRNPTTTDPIPHSLAIGAYYASWFLSPNRIMRNHAESCEIMADHAKHAPDSA